MSEKYVKLSTMLRSLRGSYPITKAWRNEILQREDVWTFAIINCNGGRAIKDRDFLFGWRKQGIKPRWFTVTERDSPTDNSEYWDVTPISREDAVELCFREGSAVLFSQSKKPPSLWMYNFLVSVCQLTKESVSFVHDL